MRQRKFSILFFLFSIIAGIIGFLVGEYLLFRLEGVIPNSLLIGIYFAQLALWIGLFALLAEVISPVINGKSWRLQYSGTSWKVFAPATIGILFVGGFLLQFIYGLTFTEIKAPDDIVLTMDISESMLETDPTNESLEAAKQLLGMMEKDHRAALITFNHEAAVTQPLFKVGDPALHDEAVNQIDQLEMIGGTDIGLALQTSMDHIKENEQKGRTPMVILFSDGYSEIDIDEAVKEYKKEKIIVNTIGMSQIDFLGAGILKDIASQTGGTFYDVSDAKELSGVFSEIYLADEGRHLVGERTGFFNQSMYLAILRVLMIVLIGGLIGLTLGIIFDNKYLAKSYIIGGAVAGLIAGLVFENGLQNTFIPDLVIRAAGDVILAVLTGLGTLLIAVKEKYSTPTTGRFDPASSKTYRRDSSIRKGF